MYSRCPRHPHLQPKPPDCEPGQPCTFFVEGVGNDRIQVISCATRRHLAKLGIQRPDHYTRNRAGRAFPTTSLPKIPKMPRRSGFALARLLYYRNDSERALAIVNRAVRLEPDQPRFYVTWATRWPALAASKRIRAIEDCDQAIQARSSDRRGRTRSSRACVVVQERRRASSLPISSWRSTRIPTTRRSTLKEESPANAPDDRPGVGPR